MADSGEIDECACRDFARLVGIVAAACGSTPLAEDAVQVAFVRAIERTRRGATIERLPAWIVAVAINETRSRWRRIATERRSVAALNGQRGGTDTDAVDTAALVDLDAAMRQLPLRQQQTVVLHYLLGLDVASVAEVLGVSVGTVKKAMSRARQQLAATLEER
ncbi:MAG: RNA polymerase sigma factor [Acidimicrobiia bacterium]|nr:RNA polymerase sigma factor [Acidimicrobiia bacterium]